MASLRVIQKSLAVLWLATLAGCGGAGDGYSGPRGTVSGTVTLDGKPIPAGSKVMFQSTGEKSSYSAIGDVGDQGKYQLNYQSNGELPAVKYDVQILPPQAVASTAQSFKPQDPTEAAKASQKLDAKEKEKANKAEKSAIPAKYGSYTSSTLKFEVKAGANQADFALKTE